MTIKPDTQDYATIDREYGPLSHDATDAERAHHYHLAVSAKLIRLYEQGKLPLDAMRAMDEIARDGKRP